MKVDSSASLESITEEAAMWFMQNRSGELTNEQRKEFWRWLQASPIHLQEYLGVAETWGVLHRSDALESIALASQQGAGMEASNIVAFRSRHARHGVRRVRRWPKKMAAGLAMVVMIGAAVFIGGRGLNVFQPGETYATGRGEQRSVVLEDGSVVQLNTLSRIRVRFEKDHRVIDLDQGEAYFRVAHDATRPFDVRTPSAVVRAVGTAFNVYNRGDRVDIAVVEGRIRVTREEGPAAPALYLAANESAEVSARKSEVRKVTTAPEASIAWMQRRLNFNGERVDAVIAEFNRYTDERVQIADPELAGLRISGTFDADDAETLITYLEEVKGVKVTREKNTVVLASKESTTRR